MKKSVIVLIHIGFWLCYSLLILIMVAVFYRSSSHTVDQSARVLNALGSILLFVIFPSVITFYIYYFRAFPKYLQQKKYYSAAIYCILTSLIAATTGYILLRYTIESGYLIDMDEGGKNGRSTAPIVIFVMTVIGTISGIVALVIKGFITWFEELKIKEELQQKNHETEMALIKSQLDPHFLFNTLNNIDVLILNNPNEASDYLNKLSDILRFMLYETKTDRILLEKEIQYIDKYIELQKIRSSNTKYVNFSVTGSSGKKLIAPMIFIPFIENAFKHSTNKKIENAITVQIFINKEEIRFVCENKFDPNQKLKQEKSGLGNELSQKRLNLIYPEKHELIINKKPDFYSVHLLIKNG